MSQDLDGLSLKFVKYIIHDISIPLAHIFNLSLDNGIFPDKLKECRTVLYQFSNLGNPKCCDNYRPISLVNTLSKILEKIVATNLTNHLQINKLLYEHQYGFQRGKSTEHNLIHVVNFIANALNNGNYCIGLFLDLKKAFGPILFLCYINDIFSATNLATFLFADDTSCLAEHHDVNELISYVNVELRKLANWFRSNKMSVNVSKTKYIIF